MPIGKLVSKSRVGDEDVPLLALGVAELRVQPGQVSGFPNGVRQSIGRQHPRSLAGLVKPDNQRNRHPVPELDFPAVEGDEVQGGAWLTPKRS